MAGCGRCLLIYTGMSIGFLRFEVKKVAGSKYDIKLKANRPVRCSLGILAFYVVGIVYQMSCSVVGLQFIIV